MKNTLVTLLLLSMSAGAIAADGRHPMRVLEEGRELYAEAVTLPATASGVMEIKVCETCPSLRLTLDPRAVLTVGATIVGFNELRTYLAANPKADVLVVSPINSELVTRIVAMPPSQ
jgi:hypothetical protein